MAVLDARLVLLTKHWEFSPQSAMPVRELIAPEYCIAPWSIELDILHNNLHLSSGAPVSLYNKMILCTTGEFHWWTIIPKPHLSWRGETPFLHGMLETFSEDTAVTKTYQSCSWSSAWRTTSKNMLWTWFIWQWKILAQRKTMKLQN